MLVTIGSYTPVTLRDAPATKALLEDGSQTESVARPPSPVPTDEEPVEESTANNQLGESYMEDL